MSVSMLPSQTGRCFPEKTSIQLFMVLDMDNSIYGLPSFKLVNALELYRPFGQLALQGAAVHAQLSGGGGDIATVFA